MYFSPSSIWVIKDDEMGRACGTCEEQRNAYRAFVEKPKGNRSLGMYRRIWEDNIKTDLNEIVGRAWTGLV